MLRIKTIKILIVILIVIAVAAVAGLVYYWVSNAPKRALEKQIIAMQGMPVNLNFENAISFIDGRDSSYVSLPEKKFIVFVDSTSCSSCFIGKLVEYSEVNDNLKSKSAQFIIILHPKRMYHDEIVDRLQHVRYPFWCIVDSEGEFVQNNNGIPDNNILHSFTLDEENKIILVGDPTRNQKIRELFFRVLE